MTHVKLFLKYTNFLILAIVLLEIHQYTRKNRAVGIFGGKHASLFGAKSIQSWKGMWAVYHLAKKSQNLALEMLQEEKCLNLESCQRTDWSQYYWCARTNHCRVCPHSGSGRRWLSDIFRTHTLMELLLAPRKARKSQKHVRTFIQVPGLNNAKCSI